jgi:hypothetical protein
MVLSESLLSLHESLIPSYLQAGGFDERTSVEFGLDSAAGIFSLLLFGLSLYAWYRRGKQPSLLIVSIAFLAFFSELLVEILPVGEADDELFSSIMDFVVLGLFFLALVVKPQRKFEEKSPREFDKIHDTDKQQQ